MATKLISVEGIGFRAFGFPVTINWFHFLLPALWLSGIDFANLRPGVSAAGIVAAYVGAIVIGVLGHELGHAFAARSIGAEAKIDLILFGGLTTWSTGKPITARQRLRVSLAGPIVGIVLGALSWFVAQWIPEWRIEIFVFLDLLTQVALIWGIFNLVPFPGFDGGHSLDAALEILAPSRAARLGAVIKGVAAVLGVAAVWYYFGVFSALILLFFVFRGGSSPLQEYRRSFDSHHESAIDEAVQLARAGRLDDALERLDATAGEPRSRDLQRSADSLRATLLFWTRRWEELAGMPDGMVDDKTRGIALMRSGKLAQAEVVFRSASTDGVRDALLAEALARQDVDIRQDDEIQDASADALVERARQVAGEAPEVASRLAEAAIDSASLSPANRVVALIIAGRLGDAGVVARDIGPDATWFAETVTTAVDGGDLEHLLAEGRSAEVMGSAQILLHQLGRYEAAIRIGRRALEAGGDLSVIGFNLACSAVQLGDTETGLAFIEALVADGLDVTRIVADADLAPLRGTDAFAEALGEPGPVGSGT
ncbi:MAG TPA: site-2 protease family protein [Acidimicrobiia bacterium]|jgi:Zn-dependent protease